MPEQPTIESLRIEEKLAQLRVEYQKRPKDRSLIIKQAEALQAEKDNLLKKKKTPEKDIDRKILFSKEYLDLGIFSYRRWIHKNWHEVFVRKQLVRRNAYGQFTAILEKVNEFVEWMCLYDSFLDARDFPNTSKYKLSEEQANKIREEKLFSTPAPLTKNERQQLQVKFSSEQTTILENPSGSPIG